MLQTVTDWYVRLRTFLEIQVNFVQEHPAVYRPF